MSDAHTDLIEEVDDDTNDEVNRSKMSFLEHLEELRKRIIYSLYAVLACLSVTFWFMDTLNNFMLRYFTLTAAGGQVKLLATELTEAFMFQFKIALLGAAIIAAPFIFMQFWLFVAPGLYAREKKIVVPFVASATVLFGTGVWFAHTIAFPTMVKFLVSFNNDYLTIMPALAIIFSMYVKVVLGLGLVFELPMLVFFLARFGVVTAGFMIKKTKYAILFIFILAAVITPSADIASQLVFAGPMMVLYAISIGVAWVFGKKKPKAAADA
jgi:sec-independent protein translocase protein TatC